MKKNFFNYGDELTRTYRILGADQAEMQNLRDIKQWWDDGLLNDDEYHELLYLNKRLHATYC